MPTQLVSNHFGEAEIQTFHKTLEKFFKKHTASKVMVLSEPRTGDWQRRATHQTVSFAMVSTEQPCYAIRRRGGRWPVARLLATSIIDPPVWFGWYEQWESLGQRNFSLTNLGLTFFQGHEEEQDKQQLFRAEWQGSQSHSAQPHWHVDWPLETELVKRTTITPDVVELPPISSVGQLVMETADSEIDVSGIHLGMAGWEFAEELPNCWQRSYGSDLQKVAVWVTRTADYAARQLSTHLQ